MGHPKGAGSDAGRPKRSRPVAAVRVPTGVQKRQDCIVIPGLSGTTDGRLAKQAGGVMAFVYAEREQQIVGGVPSPESTA